MAALNKVLGLFPGQGSQKVGMGKNLVDSSDLAREYFAVADKALGFSLSELCFNGPADKLTETAIAQPAILTVSVICYELAKRKYPDLNLVAAAGHSLGEYSALVAAGALDFKDAVQLVNKRGQYMQEAVPVGVGKMVAVLGKEPAEHEAALSKVSSGIAQIANINAPGQIVVAGKKEAVDEFILHLGKAKVMELQVSAPFHCALMEPAAKRLASDLKLTSFSNTKFPVYANFTAQPVQSAEEIKDSLEKQVCGRVRWVECMQNAIKECAPTVAVEFGAGEVLSGMLKRIAPEMARESLEIV